MNCLVNWTPLRIRLRSRNIQPYLKIQKNTIYTCMHAHASNDGRCRLICVCVCVCVVSYIEVSCHGVNLYVTMTRISNTTVFELLTLKMMTFFGERQLANVLLERFHVTVLQPWISTSDTVRWFHSTQRSVIGTKTCLKFLTDLLLPRVLIRLFLVCNMVCVRETICVCACMHICACTCVRLYPNMIIHILYRYIHIYIYIYKYVHINIYVCMYKCICIYMSVHTYAYI